MAIETEALGQLYSVARREAELMAGSRSDLAQRATVYHHLFRHSRGNHVFPLLAAHGALWGKGYFAKVVAFPSRRFTVRVRTSLPTMC